MQHFEKLLTGLWIQREFVSSDLQNTQYQVAFEDLKKEILVGHQEIAQGKSHFCSRCEKGIWSWLSWNAIRSFLQIELSRTCVTFTTIFLWIFIASKLQMAKVDLLLSALETLELFPEACPLVSSRGYGEMTNDGKPYRYMPIENYLAFYYIGEAYSVCCSYPRCKSRIGSRFL